MRLNTPTAILIGLTLIAGALFFRQPVIPEAEAQARRCLTTPQFYRSFNNLLSKIEGIVSNYCED